MGSLSMGGMNVTWDRGLNLGAYSEVEAPSNYSTPEELENYRHLLLEKSKPAAQCVKDAVYNGSRLKVLEVCSGSSRLLYALEQMDLLDVGYGVEVSQSRHRFAENWKASLGTTRVHNVQCSADEYHYAHAGFNLVIMIDGALSYLYPCDPELPGRILRRAHQCLSRGGKLLMEFDVLSQEHLSVMKREGAFRVWNRGDEKDAFKYALYQTEPMSWEHMVVQNTSTYLSRTTMEEKIKRELYKYYSVEDLNVLLHGIGFSVQHYATFASEPYTPQARSLITLAVKE
jgi:hypothetical protein